MNSTVISVTWDHLRACSPVIDNCSDPLAHSSDLLATFRVEYSAVFNADTEAISKTGQLFTTTEALLIVLNPFTNYSIEVALLNECGGGEERSYPITVQTLEDGKFYMLKLTFKLVLILLHAVPGPVGGITGTPYVSQVNLTWEPPLMPNGVIIAYEVSYRRTASSQSETRDNTTALVWASENNLEEDTEFIFSLRAYTRVGPGNYSSLTITTLGGDQSSKDRGRP